MKYDDLVTIILPIYNVEKYLKECVDSVLGQTYKNLEIILVDDGATDSSGKMSDDFAKKDERIKVVHKKNGGLNMARKSGFEVSTGDWITFVDSDDVIDERYVEYLIEGVKRHNTEMSLGGYQYFVDKYQRDDKEVSTYSKSLSSVIKMYLLDGRPDEHFFMQTAWGKLFSRRLIKLIDWDFSNYKVNEDEFMSMMYYSELKTPLAIVDNRLLYYRQRPDSIMGQNEKEYTNIYKGKKLTKFEYLGEVYDKRLERFGQRYKHEIAYWFGLHYMINLSKAYSRNHDPLTAADKKIFNDRLPQIIEASKKHRYWNEHKAIMDSIESSGSIDGFFEYKKNSPTVSVIMPVYNAERFLDESIGSIINQTYYNLDIVLVNDGSTDGSTKICDLYTKRDYRVRLINKENGGVSSARNTGLELASGQYVTFVDSDDFLELDAIEQLMSGAKRDRHGSDIYVGGVYDYHSAGYTFDYQPNSLPIEKRFTYDSVDDGIYQIMTSINSPFAKLYKREFIVSKKLVFNETIHIAEDALFVFQAAIQAKAIYKIDRPVYYYRNDLDNNYSATGTINADKALDFAKAFEQMQKLVNKVKFSKSLEGQFRRGVVAHALYNLSLAERDPIAHKKVFEATHKELVERYDITVNLVPNEADRIQVEHIIDGDYGAYTLAKLNHYKSELYRMIDEKHSRHNGVHDASFARKVASKLAPYMSNRQKLLAKKVVRRARRELSRLRSTQ